MQRAALVRYSSAVTTAKSTQHPAERLRALRNILALESKNGYQNRAVAGGLDRFLERLRADPVPHPALRELIGLGMLNVAYGALSAERRETWVREAERVIGETPAAPARAAKPQKPKAPAQTKPPEPPPAVTLDSPVTSLRSVSRGTAGKLERLRVATVRELLYLFPNRHLDYSQRRTVTRLRPGEEQTAVVSLWSATVTRLGSGGRLRATEAVVGDETGNIRVVWFGQQYLAKTLQTALARAQASLGGDVKLVLSGRVNSFGGRPQFESPEWEVSEEPEMANLVHTGRLVPVYPTTERLPQRTIRRIVREALDTVLGPSAHPGAAALEDSLPPALRERHGLLPLAEAVAQAHYPDSIEAQEEARRRLAFDELLVLQLAMAAKRRETPQEASIPLRPVPEVLGAFERSLPFRLTQGQRGAIDDALADLERSDRPMSRLLQGDVGSGKTVVAVALLLTAVANGYQGVFMAPTEVLAEQHYLNVTALLSGLPTPARDANWFSVSVEGHPRPISVGLLTGSTRAAARRELHERVRDGTIDILIGTHAVIQREVEVPKLALGVVDEQHRFGVLQRAALRGKGAQPHLLAMSATPIPRTLALTLYGDLEVSTMPELPSGRQPIATRYVVREQRERAEAFIVEQVGQGRQAFVVCPLIEESESVQAKAATEEYDRLRDTSLAALRLGLLHGRMALREKQGVMDAFRAGELDVLVATPVIEVGIDVPNATVMLIEGADRFGLAQLHQLRGRVGRGAHKSYCLLLAEEPSEEAKQRLETLVHSNDGFDIAEADLRLRGPGDFFGTRQSGLPALRMARLSDRDLLSSSRDDARELVASDSRVLSRGLLGQAVRRYSERVVEEVG